MKKITINFVMVVAVLTAAISATIFAQNGADAATSASAAPDAQSAEKLDLYAVAELFKESENLEKFEQALNNPADGINNLDLNNNNDNRFHSPNGTGSRRYALDCVASGSRRRRFSGCGDDRRRKGRGRKIQFANSGGCNALRGELLHRSGAQ